MMLSRKKDVDIKTTLPATLESFIDKNKTLSLPNILEKLEYQVLLQLKEKTNRIKGAIFASGIKEVTLHKKMERHNTRRSVESA